MVFKQFFARRTARDTRINRRDRSGRTSRKLRLETLTKRVLLASDLAVIEGTTFTDLTGDGLSGDDRILTGVTVDLFRDVNTNGVLDGPDGAAIDTQVSDANGFYRFSDLTVDTYFVVQTAVSADIQAPATQTVAVAAADGVLIDTIDDFSATLQNAMAVLPVGSDPDSLSAPEAIGGERDMQANRTAGTSVNATSDPGNSLLDITTTVGGTGSVLLQYDGADNSLTRADTGLGGIALAGGTAGGDLDPDAGILVVGSTVTPGDTIDITLYTDGANFATFSRAIETDTGAPLEEFFVKFSDFTATGTPDFNNIGSIEVDISVAAGNSIEINELVARAPNINTQNLANTQLVTLRGTVFDDFGTGADANNGVQDAGELGIAGVEVELYDRPTAAPIDPGTQVAIATTTTDANGDYSFANLAEGDYLVLIPDAEFAATEPLEDLASSDGNDPAPDPDDDADSDDNGSELVGVGISSGTISLAPNTEPINDDDTNPDTNSTVDFGFAPAIDLEVTKTLDAGSSTLAAGGTAIFDIDFQNNGPNDATAVVITDVIPTGLTLDQGSSTFAGGTVTLNGQNLSVDLGTVSNGSNGTIRLVMDIDSLQTADFSNTAAIASAREVDTVSANNSNDANVDLVNTDLVVTKTDNLSGAAVAGTQMTYTITVTNNGPDTATGISATDTLPSDVTFVSGTFTSGSGTVTDNGNSTLTINVDDLASSASATIDVVVDINSDAGSSIQNDITVTTSPNTELVPADNTASVITTVDRNVDVGITKTSTGTPTAGGQITFEFEVTNNGPGDARGVSVVDTLNSAFTFDSFDAGTSGVSLTPTGQTMTFDVGTLASGQTENFSIIVDIDAAATGSIANSASITTTDTDTSSTNDSSSVNVTIGQEIDLVLAKAVDLSTAVPGQDTLTYTFTITHDTDSLSDSGQVTFTDTLPTGLTGATITAPNATSSSFDSSMQTVTVVFSNIAAGQSETFTVTATVDEDATGTLTNTGSITLAQTEADTTNNSDTASTTMAPEFDVTLTKTADDTTPNAGSNVTYSIVLTNSGPSTATGVVLTDDLPTGLTFVSGTLDGNAATVNGSTVTFVATTLDSGASKTATLVATVDANAPASITNTATVTADSGETDTTNNTAQESLSPVGQADVTVSKSANASAAQVGQTLTYTITVSNTGTTDAADVSVVDTLPAGVTVTNTTNPANTTISENNGVVTLDVGTLAAGNSLSFTIDATIDSGTSGTLTNTATVSTTTAETDTSNNSATAATTVDPVTSTISGAVYVDDDNDGIRDAGEAGISGVTITLTGTDSLGNSVNRTAITDSNGDYSFNQLPAGTYQIAETQPSNFDDGQDTVGTGATATAADDLFTNLGLGVDTDAVDFNFGEQTRIEAFSLRRFLASS